MVLSKADLKLAYAVLKAYSKLHILPIKIDTGAGQIQLEKKQQSLILWKICWNMVAFHTLFKNIRLLQVFLDPEKYFVFAHFPLHLANAMTFDGSVFYIYKMFVQLPAETVITFNETNDFPGMEEFPMNEISTFNCKSIVQVRPIRKTVVEDFGNTVCRN